MNVGHKDVGVPNHPKWAQGAGLRRTDRVIIDPYAAADVWEDGVVVHVTRRVANRTLATYFIVSREILRSREGEALLREELSALLRRMGKMARDKVGVGRFKRRRP